MANTILHKRSSVSGRVPAAGDLQLGELAINTADGFVYLKKSDGTVVQASPDFANFGHSIVPDTDLAYDLGSPTKMWRDIYVGPGSLYVNGQKVLEDNSGTITVGADTDQNIRIQSKGAGDIEFYPSDTGVIQMKGTLSVLAGKNFTSSDANPISVAVGFDMNGENITNLAAPSASSDAATKAYVDSQVAAYDNTDELTEGAANLFFTNARARGAISVSDAGGDGSLSYNSTSGVITYTGPSAAQVRAHFTGSDGVGYNASTGVFSLDNTTVSAGSYGDASHVATFTVDANGRITAAGEVSVAGVSSTEWNATTGTFTINTADGGSYAKDLGLGTADSVSFANVTSGNVTVNGSLYSDDVTAATMTATGNVVVQGNLTVNGTTTTVNSTVVEIDDLNLTTAASANTAAEANGGGLTVGGAAASFTYTSADDRWNMNKNLNVGTVYGNVVGNVTGNLTGNASSASTADKWDNARTITLGGDLSGSVSIDGTSNVTLTAAVADDSHNHVVGNIDGLAEYIADTAGAMWSSNSESGVTVTYQDADNTLDIDITSAPKWETARTITLGGDLSGNVSIDGSANVTLTATVADDSHNHTIANIDGLQTALDGKLTAGATSGNGISGSASSGTFTVSSNATSANTANTIVFRDASGNFSAGTISATVTQAQYADLAEKYVADADIEPGTVVEFGGEQEVTACSHDMCSRVAGVVSTAPAYIMNSELEADHVATVAFTGRVPCKVVGEVRKGDLMVSAGNGAARAEAEPKVGTVIGKALENFDGAEGVIEVVVGRF